MSGRAGELATARALLAGGGAAAAAAHLQRVLAADPRWGRGWLLLGQCHAQAGSSDDAAVSFLRACDGGCDDASPALSTAAAANAALCVSRVLPRHALAWLRDGERSAAFAAAVQAALRAALGSRVLCGGSTAAACVLHAALAAEAGAPAPVAVCGSALVASLAAALTPVHTVAQLPASAAPAYDALAWDFGNRLDAPALAAYRAARAACAPAAAIVPSRLCVRAAVVECAALLELNAAERVHVPLCGDDAAAQCFELRAFAEAYTRDTRAVSLQAASLQPWRVLTGALALCALRAPPRAC